MPSFRLRCVPRIAAGVVSSLVLVQGAWADISGTVFTIRAENEQGVAEFSGLLREGSFSAPGVFDWVMGKPIALTSEAGVQIALINAAAINVHEDPDVSLNFAVSAGATSTSFTLTSAHVVFSSIGVAEGRATVSVNATDLNEDGVFLSPVGALPMYQTRYNGEGSAGTVFHDMLASPLSSAAPGSSVAAALDYPAPGTYAPISGAVTDISSRFQFVLSSGDTASGTSFFRVQEVPGPAGAGVLALAGMVAARRRRR